MEFGVCLKAKYLYLKYFLFFIGLCGFNVSTLTSENAECKDENVTYCLKDECKKYVIDVHILSTSACGFTSKTP